MFNNFSPNTEQAGFSDRGAETNYKFYEMLLKKLKQECEGDLDGRR